MKLLTVSAGRKYGNNEVLAKEAMLAAAEITSVEPHLIRLSDLNIKPCTGCEGCMKKRLRGGESTCVQTGDDYQWLVSQIRDADALIDLIQLF